MSLLVESEGGEAEELVDEENGVLISTMLRQYFMALRTVGQWKNISQRWMEVANNATSPGSPKAMWSDQEMRLNTPPPRVVVEKPLPSNGKKMVVKEVPKENASEGWSDFLRKRMGVNLKPLDDDVEDTSDDGHDSDDEDVAFQQMDLEMLLMRKFWSRWAYRAGVKSKVCDPLEGGDCLVDWTRVIAPVLEGRIKMVEE